MVIIVVILVVMIVVITVDSSSIAAELTQTIFVLQSRGNKANPYLLRNHIILNEATMVVAGTTEPTDEWFLGP